MYFKNIDWNTFYASKMKKDASFFPSDPLWTKNPRYWCQNPLSQSSAWASTIEKSLMIDYHLTATYIPANISDGIRWRHFTQFQHGVASKTIFLDSCDISKLDPFSKNLMIIFLDPTVKIVWKNLNFQFLLEKMPSKNQQDLFLKFAWSRNQCLPTKHPYFKTQYF